MGDSGYYERETENLPEEGFVAGLKRIWAEFLAEWEQMRNVE